MCRLLRGRHTPCQEPEVLCAPRFGCLRQPPAHLRLFTRPPCGDARYVEHKLLRSGVAAPEGVRRETDRVSPNICAEQPDRSHVFGCTYQTLEKRARCIEQADLYLLHLLAYVQVTGRSTTHPTLCPERPRAHRRVARHLLAQVACLHLLVLGQRYGLVLLSNTVVIHPPRDGAVVGREFILARLHGARTVTGNIEEGKRSVA